MLCAPSCSDKKSQAPETSAKPAEEILPEYLSQPMFRIGELKEICGEGLFGGSSYYVELGVDTKGIHYYRMSGNLSVDPKITFDFVGDTQAARNLSAEAKFVTGALRAGLFDEIGDQGASALHGVIHSVDGIWTTIQTICSSTWRLVSDSEYRERFLADIGRWTRNIGYDLKNLTWHQVWDKLEKMGEWVRNTSLEDAKNFVTGIAAAYWENEREKEAQARGFSTESIRLGPTSWNAIDQRTWAHIGGTFVPDVALITLAVILAPETGGGSLPAAGGTSAFEAIGSALAAESEGALIAERLASADKLRKMERLFPEAGLLAARETVANRVKASAIATRAASLRKLTPLLDPKKIATLSGDRAMNSRLKKTLYYLYESENAGMKPSEALDEIYSAFRGVELPKGTIYSETLEKRNIMENYRLARQWGLFDTPENLEAMRKGASPTILKGQYAGELVEMDHRIAVAHAPELSNSPANLIITPKSVNRARGATIDQRTRKAVTEFQRVSRWLPSSEFTAKLVEHPQ